MLFIPEIKLTMFNAGVPALPLWLTGWFFLKLTDVKVAERLIDRSWYNPKDKKIGNIFIITYYIMVFSTFLTPLPPINTIQFTIGMIIYLIGLIPMLIAYYNYAKSPLDKPITAGVYKYSRNPMYFFSTIGFFGLVIVSSSIVILTLLIICVISQHFLILSEERYCLEAYGEEYRSYMKKVPRYFLFF